MPSANSSVDKITLIRRSTCEISDVKISWPDFLLHLAVMQVPPWASSVSVDTLRVKKKKRAFTNKPAIIRVALSSNPFARQEDSVSLTRFLSSLLVSLTLTCAIPAHAHPAPPGPVTIDFESLSTGGKADGASLLSVFRQFASLGIIFNGVRAVDYSAGPSAIPGFAHSGNKGIETCIDTDFCTTPILMSFTTPQSHIKVFVGYSAPLSQTMTVGLKVFDSAGTVIGVSNATFGPSSGPQAIQLPLEVSTQVPTIMQASVSLSAGNLVLNNNLAVDDVQFDVPGPPPQCTATSSPVITMMSPTTGDVEYNNDFRLQGSIATTDALDAVQLLVMQGWNGGRTVDLLSPGIVGPNGGSFAQRLNDVLFPGLNDLEVVAQNCHGSTSFDIFNLKYFSPSPPQFFGVEINQGLPGYPLVAGKSTLARVYVGAMDLTGATEIDSGQLDIIPQQGGSSTTISADIQNPHLLGGQRYTENDNINFYIPGSLLRPGQYNFVARLFKGSDLVRSISFEGNPYTFTQTFDVQVLVVLPDFFRYGRPVSEVGLLMDYLSDVARSLPVRDGWGLIGANAGLQVSLRPFEPVCDGTFPSPFPNCGPTREEVDNDVWAPFKWRLIQPRVSGQLRAGLSAPITPGVPCASNAKAYQDDGSGRLATELVNGAFLYFPGWLPNGADPAFDINYDGRVDSSDLRPYVSEYFSNRNSAWSVDVTQLSPGDVVHSFTDSNRDCTFQPPEPQSPFTQVHLISWMIQKARALADASGIPFAAYTVWPGMDQFGTAGGTSYGADFWAVLKPQPTFHHELGHGFGLVSPESPNFDNFFHSKNFNVMDQRAFNVIRRKAFPDAPSIMSGRGIQPPFYGSLFENYEYQAIFDQLRVPTFTFPTSAFPVSRRGVLPVRFVVSGYIDKRNHFQLLESSITSVLPLTSLSKSSPYTIVFLGKGNKVLAEDRVPVIFESKTEHVHIGPHIYHDDAFVHLVRPLPKGTVAFELRARGRTLARVNRQTAAPTVKIKSIYFEKEQSSDLPKRQPIIVSWQTNGKGNARLTYTVLYSADEGKSWAAVGTGITDSKLEWDARGWAGCLKCLVKVIVSDGFNTAFDVSEPFQISAKAPIISIRPELETEWKPDSFVALGGSAFDLQDGPLSNTSLRWSSETEKELGTGNSLKCKFPPGRHIVTLVGTNSLGISASAQIPIVVPNNANADNR